jgi:hypothetical protein
MATYLFSYHGGAGMVSGEERDRAMAAWGAWFGRLGAAVVDPGNPGGATRIVAADGSVTDGGPASPTGYSLVTAGSLDEAVAAAKGCPVLADGGMVEVTEIIPAM